MELIKEKTDVVKEELERICKANDGILRPADVVKAATPKSSVLHDRFTWDDTEAARQFRLVEARQLIRVTVTLLETPETGPVDIRAYVSLVPDRDNGDSYRRTLDVMSNEEYRLIAVEQAKQELIACKKKYGLYSELAKVWKAIRELE